LSGFFYFPHSTYFKKKKGKSKNKIFWLLPRAVRPGEKERGCLFKFKIEQVAENYWLEGGDKSKSYRVHMLENFFYYRY
jgi:hypothetical protein